MSAKRPKGPGRKSGRGEAVAVPDDPEAELTSESSEVSPNTSSDELNGTGTSGDQAGKDVPEESSSLEGPSEESTPSEHAPEESNPPESLPGERTPSEDAPEESSSSASPPEESTPSEDPHEDSGVPEDSTPPDSDNDPREHDPWDRCPWGHGMDGVEYCTCHCPGCRPAVRQREREIREGWPRGDFDTHGRVSFSPPPPLRPRGVIRQPTTRLPPDIMSIISHYNGAFYEPETHEAIPGDPEQHHALTFALGQLPCTEQIPWNTRVGYWDTACPNDRRQVGWNDLYLGHIEACQTRHPRCPSPSEEGPPGDPDTPDGRRYVCEEHFEDSKKFYEIEKMYKAHLVGICRRHMRHFIRRYPLGFNSCTCRNLMNTWQCRLCYRKSVLKLENHFRRRVLAPHQGGQGDREMLTHPEYYLDWKDVRRMLVRDHPCNHRCGRKRVLNNYRNCLVMDCRACGGIIVRRTRIEKGQDCRLDYATGLERVFPMPEDDSSDVEMTPYDQLPAASDNDSDATTIKVEDGEEVEEAGEVEEGALAEGGKAEEEPEIVEEVEAREAEEAEEQDNNTKASSDRDTVMAGQQCKRREEEASLAWQIEAEAEAEVDEEEARQDHRQDRQS